MIYKIQRITIVRTRNPPKRDLNEELLWLGSSLGLFGLRDKDKSCFRVFIELLKHTKEHRSVSSDELAANLSLTRGTVVHHINRLIETGLVIPERRGYILRVGNLEALVDEVQTDVNETCNKMRQIAKEIDGMLGL